MKSIKRFLALTALVIITASVQAGNVPSLGAATETDSTIRSFGLTEETQSLSLFEKGQIATEILGSGAAALCCGVMAVGVLGGLDKLGPKNYAATAFFAYIAYKFGGLTIAPLRKILG